MWQRSCSNRFSWQQTSQFQQIQFRMGKESSEREGEAGSQRQYDLVSEKKHKVGKPFEKILRVSVHLADHDSRF